MQWQLLWYVLAGLIIGFTASTLWEWLYFRRKRMDLRDQRLLELETELRMTREQLYDLRAQTPPSTLSPAADYQSPGVFLESEEAESLRDEGYAPARGAVYTIREPASVHPAPSVYAPASPPAEPPSPFVASEKAQPAPSTATAAAIVAGAEGVTEPVHGKEDDAARERAVAAALGGVAVGAVAVEAMQTRGEEAEEIGPGVIESEVAEPEGSAVSVAVVEPEVGEGEAVSAEVIDIERIKPEEGAVIVAATLAEGESEEPLEPLEPEAGEDEAARVDVIDVERVEPEEVTAAVAAATLAEGESEEPPESLEPEAGEDEAARVDVIDVEEVEPEEPVAAGDPFAVLGWRPTRSPDDLAAIKGIGSRYRDRLYNAGVYTFAELAAMDPDELRQAARAMRTVDIESWRRQAQELAAESGRENVRYFGPRPDDLTAIKGITPQIMRRLYQRGVVTYAQLALLSERELAENLADLGVAESPDLRTWLVKATELSQARLDPPQGGDQ